MPARQGHYQAAPSISGHESGDVPEKCAAAADCRLQPFGPYRRQFTPKELTRTEKRLKSRMVNGQRSEEVRVRRTPSFRRRDRSAILSAWLARAGGSFSPVATFFSFPIEAGTGSENCHASRSGAGDRRGLALRRYQTPTQSHAQGAPHPPRERTSPRPLYRRPSPSCSWPGATAIRPRSAS
jgi:hypothetical protein